MASRRNIHQNETYHHSNYIWLSLSFGLIANRLFLKSIMGSVWKITDDGWRNLTLRFSLFFFLRLGIPGCRAGLRSFGARVQGSRAGVQDFVQRRAMKLNIRGPGKCYLLYVCCWVLGLIVVFIFCF